VNPDGNERLTEVVGALLLVPIAIELATIPLGVHGFMSTHVFVGLLLIPPVLLKLASTTWRFVRYYTRSRLYVEYGPPQLVMRVLAPLFVAATIVLFGSGVAMGFLHGSGLSIARRLHGPASVVWVVVLGLHVLVYLQRALRGTAAEVVATKRRAVMGANARTAVLVLAVAAGFAVAAAAVPAQHRWVDLQHGHHHRGHGS
jgi:hypothetical protein